MTLTYFHWLAPFVLAAPLPSGSTNPPEGPTPRIMVVSSMNKDKGEVTCIETVLVGRKVTVLKKVVEQGVIKTVPESVEVTTNEVRTAAYPLTAKAKTADGKPISKEDLPKRLVAGAPILVLSGRDKVDPAYLKIIRPETVILFASPLHQPEIAVPPPPPPPKPK